MLQVADYKEIDLILRRTELSLWAPPSTTVPVFHGLKGSPPEMGSELGLHCNCVFKSHRMLMWMCFVLFIQKVVERFHRNGSKPANEDVAERVFLISESLIELTYHLMEGRLIPTKISFIKPKKSEKAQEFSLDMSSSFQVHVANA